MSLLIRQTSALNLTQSDLDQLKLFAEAWSTTGEFWTYQSLLESTQDLTYKLWTARSAPSRQWQALALTRTVEYETELIYLYTLEEFRGQHIASTLLHNIVQAQKARLSKTRSSLPARMFLEVRVSNKTAQRLYLQCGFLESGIRKNYYSNGEDAVLMSQTLSSK